MKKKNENAITLIALVVTIVVLLILAGVSISMLTGDNGVIAQANKSSIKTDNGTVLENVRLKITEYKGRINDEKVTNRLEQLKSDGIIDDQGVVDCKKLIGQKLKTGNGSNNEDGYVIEEDELYYYDKNGNKDYLGDIGKDEEVSDETDSSIFDITDDGVISIKQEYGYYENGTGYWDDFNLEEITIPSEINGKKAKYIAGIFLSHNSKIKKVYISEGIEVIGGQAFAYCSNLTDIIIPEGVTTIGWRTFEACGNLKSVTIPDSVTDIEQSFRESGLNTISLGNGITNIGWDTFSGCTQLTSIEIPESVTSIGETAFYNCRSLKNIVIPDSVTSLGNYSFYNCSELESIIMEIGVENINQGAFLNCKNLTTVNYRGTQEQWNAITKGSNNDSLINATINFNYTGE